MPLRVIIINWKFKDKHKKEYKTSDDKIICLNTNKVSVIKNELKNFGDKKILLLLHQNLPNKDVTPDDFSEDSNEKFKVFPFKGGGDMVYYVKGNGLLDPNGETLHSKCLENEKIKKENFEFVWNWYWDTLEKQRKISDLLDKMKRDSDYKSLIPLYNLLYNEEGDPYPIKNISEDSIDKIKGDGELSNREDIEKYYNKIEKWLSDIPGKIY